MNKNIIERANLEYAPTAVEVANALFPVYEESTVSRLGKLLVEAIILHIYETAGTTTVDLKAVLSFLAKDESELDKIFAKDSLSAIAYTGFKRAPEGLKAEAVSIAYYLTFNEYINKKK